MSLHDHKKDPVQGKEYHNPECFTCQYDQQTLDVKMSKDLREHGCVVVAIINGHTYSIGISAMLGKAELFLPEFLPSKMAHYLINTYNDKLKSGIEFELDQGYSDFIQDFDVVFKRVSKKYYAAHFGKAIDFYGDEDFEVWQMVLPDKNGFFPWNDKVNAYFKQPKHVLFDDLGGLV